jgi:hypothetical protein
LDRKKEEIVAFQRAIQRALTDIHGDPTTDRELLGRYLRGTARLRDGAGVPPGQWAGQEGTLLPEDVIPEVFRA